MEGPLEKVDICASLGGSLSLAGFLSLFVLDGFFLLDIIAGQRENKLRILARCSRNAPVCFKRDNCADGSGVRCMTESPNTLDLLGRKVEELLHVDEGVQGLDAAGLGFLGLGCGLLRTGGRTDSRG